MTCTLYYGWSLIFIWNDNGFWLMLGKCSAKTWIYRLILILTLIWTN
jgi:hypothetical protein